MPTNNIQTRSTTSGSTSASRSNGFSSRDDSSGGVPLNSHKALSTGGGTIYAGSASNMGSSRATATSASVAPSLNTQSSSRAGYSPSVATSSTSIAGKRAAFNPDGYGSPGRRSPTGSVAMDAVRQQHKDMRHQAANKAKEKADDLEVSDSESD
jgi:hypothetical protein